MGGPSGRDGAWAVLVNAKKKDHQERAPHSFP
jgi:hypothetical protein